MLTIGTVLYLRGWRPRFTAASLAQHVATLDAAGPLPPDLAPLARMNARRLGMMLLASGGVRRLGARGGDWTANPPGQDPPPPVDEAWLSILRSCRAPFAAFEVANKVRHLPELERAALGCASRPGPIRWLDQSIGWRLRATPGIVCRKVCGKMLWKLADQPDPSHPTRRGGKQATWRAPVRKARKASAAEVEP